MLSTVVQGEPNRKVTIVVWDVVAHLGYNAPHGNEINIHIGYSISIDFIKNYCSISWISFEKSYFQGVFIWL